MKPTTAYRRFLLHAHGMEVGERITPQQRAVIQAAQRRVVG